MAAGDGSLLSIQQDHIAYMANPSGHSKKASETLGSGGSQAPACRKNRSREDKLRGEVSSPNKASWP